MTAVAARSLPVASDAYLSWSGGKNSPLARWTLCEKGRRPGSLLTTEVPP